MQYSGHLLYLVESPLENCPLFITYIVYLRLDPRDFGWSAIIEVHWSTIDVIHVYQLCDKQLVLSLIKHNIHVP